MFIACKYEEIYAPELVDFVYVCDKAYSKEEILGNITYVIIKRNGK
jgi:cyclin B